MAMLNTCNTLGVVLYFLVKFVRRKWNCKLLFDNKCWIKKAALLFITRISSVKYHFKMFVLTYYFSFGSISLWNSTLESDKWWVFYFNYTFISLWAENSVPKTSPPLSVQYQYKNRQQNGLTLFLLVPVVGLYISRSDPVWCSATLCTTGFCLRLLLRASFLE